MVKKSKSTPKAVRVALRDMAHKIYDNHTRQIGGDVTIEEQLRVQQVPLESPKTDFGAVAATEQVAQGPVEPPPLKIARGISLNIKEFYPVKDQPGVCRVIGTLAKVDGAVSDPEAFKAIKDHTLAGEYKPMFEIRAKISETRLRYIKESLLTLDMNEVALAPFGHRGNHISKSGKTVFLCEPELHPDYHKPARQNDFALRLAQQNEFKPEFTDIGLHNIEIEDHPYAPGYLVVRGELHWEPPRDQNAHEIYYKNPNIDFAEVITGIPRDQFEEGGSFLFEKVDFLDLTWNDTTINVVDPRRLDEIVGTPEHERGVQLLRVKKRAKEALQAADVAENVTPAAERERALRYAKIDDINHRLLGKRSSNQVGYLTERYATEDGRKQEEPVDPIKAIHPDLHDLGALKNVMVLPFSKIEEPSTIGNLTRRGPRYIHGEVTSLDIPSCKNVDEDINTKNLLTVYGEFPPVHLLTGRYTNRGEGTEFPELQFYKYRGEFIAVDADTVKDVPKYIGILIFLKLDDKIAADAENDSVAGGPG